MRRQWSSTSPLFIHPASPINQRAMGDYRLVPILGFGVDTTLSILRLVFSGILKRLPGLKLVASHLGGVYPYLRGRIDRGFQAYPECKVNISEPPSRYLREIWMDSICYDEDVLMSAYTFSGAEKIVLGSDHPPPDRGHRICRGEDKETPNRGGGEEQDPGGERGEAPKTLTDPSKAEGA
jgi:hypothetical protein